MPFRSKSTLEAWITEFRLHHDDADLVRVMFQDGVDGADTGLVLIPLTDDRTEVVIEPESVGADEWTIRFAARENPFDLSPAQLRGLARELSTAAELCLFLESKSVGHLETNPDDLDDDDSF